MKRRAIEEIVYEHMFPHPKPTDPQNWSSFLQRNLITEVRQETQRFYGGLDTREAQYPGLDYSHPPHRKRLGRYTWHRRLFRAFDYLGLTKPEIAALTHWEGTLWAKERFEKEQGIRIRDTTSDGIKPWVPREFRVSTMPALEFVAVTLEHACEDSEMAETYDDDDDDDDEDEAEEYGDGQMDVEDSDAEMGSVGTALNERLHAGYTDEEYEEWLKAHTEGEMERIRSLRAMQDDAGMAFDLIRSRSNQDQLPSQRRAIFEATLAQRAVANQRRSNEVSGVTSNSRESFRATQRSYEEVRDELRRSLRAAEHAATNSSVRQRPQLSALRSSLQSDFERRTEQQPSYRSPRQQ